MEARFGLVSILFAVLLCPSLSTGQIERTKTSSYLIALALHDNDISLDQDISGDTVEVPGSVRRIIWNLVNKDNADWSGADSSVSRGVVAHAFDHSVFRISAPSGNFLFVLKRELRYGGSYYNFIMFNSASQAVTIDPPAIWGKWMDGGDWGGSLEKPLVHFEGSDQDSSSELVVEERVHNGNTYNAIVYHYFRIQSDLSLKHEIALETRLVDEIHEEQGGLILRQLVKIAPDSLRLDVYLKLPNREKEKIGEVTLSRHKSQPCYHIMSRTCYNPEYRDILITGSEEADIVFLCEGYTFNY
jgi:hypothetical protein